MKELNSLIRLTIVFAALMSLTACSTTEEEVVVEEVPVEQAPPPANEVQKEVLDDIL